MASGDAVVQILQIMPPSSIYATFDIRAGGSAPAENIPVWDFDASTSEYLDMLCKLEGYGGSGVTFTAPWSASTATTGTVRWEVGIRRVQDDAEDIDGSHSYSFLGVSDTVATASGELSYPTIALPSTSAALDSWAEGEIGVVRIYRSSTNSADTMSGDAELWTLLGLET
jgi:hypothetical protein